MHMYTPTLSFGFDTAVAETAAEYNPHADVLMQNFLLQTNQFSGAISRLADLRRDLSLTDEEKIKFKLEALLDMRRELMREARLRS